MLPLTLMTILAHPDDESFPMGGTLAKAAAEGQQVHLVVATRGEAGIPGKSATETAVLREAELRRACAELGVQRLTLLDYMDGELANVPDGSGAVRLLALMRHAQPDVVVTFGTDGISGHPDHLAVHRWTTAAFDQYKQEQERPPRLYYIAPSEATQQGCGIPPSDTAVDGPVAFIAVGDYLVQKVQAAQQHRSQNPPFNGDPETAGVRIGLAALEALGAERSGAKSLHAIVEYGDHHGAMCFGDGIQYTTGCTFGKGNISKTPKGKLAVTLVDKANKKAVRVAYKPALQKQIKESAFMQKRSAGVPPTQILEAEQWELVNLIWDAPAEQMMTVETVVDYDWQEPAEIIRFAVCSNCGELVAEPYLRIVEGNPLCMDCAGYAV